MSVTFCPRCGGETFAGLAPYCSLECKMDGALTRIAGLNDLSEVPDDEIEAAARLALSQCEIIAQDALCGDGPSFPVLHDAVLAMIDRGIDGPDGVGPSDALAVWQVLGREASEKIRALVAQRDACFTALREWQRLDRLMTEGRSVGGAAWDELRELAAAALRDSDERPQSDGADPSRWHKACDDCATVGGRPICTMNCSGVPNREKGF